MDQDMEDGMDDGREWHPLAPLFLSLTLFLLLFSSFVDWAGFVSFPEKRLLGLIHPFPAADSRVVLLSMTPGERGLRSMDVALALRGLGMLRARSIVIDAPVEEEADGVKILPDLLSRLKNDPKGSVRVILPDPSSPNSRYAPVFAGKSGSSALPLIPGLPDPSGGSFLPDRGEKLQLLGRLSGGATVGSCWWWALPVTDRRASPPASGTLFSSRFLILPNHAVLRISGSGSWSGPPVAGVSTVTLDDFLFAMELRERGTIRPEFDALWSGSTVVIAPPGNLPMILAFRGMLEETVLRRLSLPWQALLTAGCLLFTLILVHAGPGFRILMGGMLLVCWLTAALLLLGKGLLIPLLPPVCLLLCLLLPWDIRTDSGALATVPVK
jgi:hypothetical protein